MKSRHRYSISTALLALTTFSALTHLAIAQKSSATCSSDWDWTNNKERESPCQVAAQLLSLCESNPSSFTLSASDSYIPSGSSTSLQANTCSCNVVAYNLLMACQACQRGNSQTGIPTWSTYGGSCATCSTENGISPGPCSEQDNPGFPTSVRPQKGSIGVPAWALENTSPSAWSAAAARRAASFGQEKLISAPAALIPPPDKGSNQGKNDASNKKSDKSPEHSQTMKVPVIICTCLAAVILTAFVAYLLRV